jgi:hypothetical protein
MNFEQYQKRNKKSYSNSKSTENLCASDIKFRLPNVLFTGPNSLYNQRNKRVDDIHEIGIGKWSMLRSMDANYITRGTNNDFYKQRRDFPGEIGWYALSIHPFPNLLIFVS